VGGKESRKLPGAYREGQVALNGAYLPWLWRATDGTVYRCLGKEKSEKLWFKQFFKLPLACRMWEVHNLNHQKAPMSHSLSRPDRPWAVRGARVAAVSQGHGFSYQCSEYQCSEAFPWPTG
jgi:hypothetical protein